MIAETFALLHHRIGQPWRARGYDGVREEVQRFVVSQRSLCLSSIIRSELPYTSAGAVKSWTWAIAPAIPAIWDADAE